MRSKEESTIEESTIIDKEELTIEESTIDNKEEPPIEESTTISKEEPTINNKSNINDSTFFITPKWIKNKKCIINPQNKNNKCFNIQSLLLCIRKGLNVI